MDAFCPMVSVGMYCIVEDTKMSRWSTNGPLEAVKTFMTSHSHEFEMDRDRELLFSHHVMGYLKRKDLMGASLKDTKKEGRLALS